MESLASSTRQVWFLVAVATLLVVAANGQMSSPCTASMISSFTPCMNFITNSSTNGTAPTADCCNALKSLTGGSMDCACQLLTGNINIPFQLPINRSLAISLPRACNTPGVPLQCKAAGAPSPAPGPTSLSPASSPADSTTPATTSPAVSPATDVGPTTPTAAADTPAATTETRPNVTPSASHRIPPSLLLFGLGLVAALNYF